MQLSEISNKRKKLTAKVQHRMQLLHFHVRIAQICLLRRLNFSFMQNDSTNTLLQISNVYFRKKNHKNKSIKISASQLKGKQIMEKSYLREHTYSHNPVDENNHILLVFLPWCILGNIETIKQNIDHHSSCASSKSARCICNLCSYSIELQ